MVTPFLDGQMILLHKLVLYALLLFLGISLVYPGLMELFKTQPGSSDFADTKNQFRALHGTMAGVGMLVLWICLDLEHRRDIVLRLGIIMGMLVIVRGNSIGR